MLKRGFALIMICIFMVSVISATTLSDFWNKVTGRATSDTTSLNITVGNSAPTIPVVQTIAAQNPTDGTTKSITFNFTAEDSDGAANLDDSTAAAYFQKAGETTRSNASCTAGATSGDQKNYTCTIDMWYFDGNGAWTINVTIDDINNAHTENSSATFTYNLLTAMVMNPTSLSWPSVGLSDTDTGSDNDPILMSNTGNDNSLTINVTAYDLEGETTSTEFIYAENFTVGVSSQGCSGTAMVNGTSTEVSSAVLNKGNYSVNDGSTGQEQLYFCLKGLPQDISSQSYSSAGVGAWTVEIVT
jgi:hypothetical protein